ncbi:RNA methyltransferase [Ramlibacter sp. AW1]|uniref:RNA methyltransferase n=1 Tax=Ramlibacter aurantiacus TaxID=2801330 RepID=A0A937D6Y9_9BURK|nr:RNA methyltransferase [Ramlibacter aurantiacus]MBL0420381.1 RNA methyltransferase [Ramlibacter aurantiacus]
MTDAPVSHISSRDNAWLKTLRRLAQDSTAYRKLGQVWIEGDHLCRALLARGHRPEVAVFSAAVWARAGHEWTGCAPRILVVADELFVHLSGLESAAGMGFVLPLPSSPPVDPRMATVVLDRLQDAGNVGAILRCAAAFGFGQVLALKGTSAIWSPKVLRAGMGAHFGLRLVESATREQVKALQVPILATSSHHGEYLHRSRLPWPCAWVFGHEGQGVGEELAALARARVRIIQPGGEESLNVATAAAICLHASAAAHGS